MKQPLIYICEDDLALGKSIQSLLVASGYRCLVSIEAEELRDLMGQEIPDLLLLDYQLPGEDGISIAQRYCSSIPRLRAIVMSVKSDKAVMQHGYSAGAMMFLPKPFDPEVLLACLRGVFVPAPVNEVSLFCTANKLVCATADVRLTAPEVKLLSCIATEGGGVVEYFQLMNVLGLPVDEQGKVRLEVVVSRLRKKLKVLNEHCEFGIKNKQKVGYYLQGQLNIHA